MRGFIVAKGAPMINHYLYADDSIIFLKENYKNACNLRQILDKFSCWSGQVVSDVKSTLLTSSNLSRSFTMGMAKALRVQIAKTPGIGGVVRDDAGSFVAGFSRYIFQNGNNVVEVRDTRDGLQLAVQVGIKKLKVNCDSNYTVQLCTSEAAPPWYLRGLVQDINALKEKFEDVVFVHQYRESNFITDNLSKKASDRTLEGVWFTNPPEEIVNNLVADIQGVSYPRMIKV
ncbi:uncharacterized protein LOC113326017 [Papaver somniferum]|uniref:uncharacterized protein LOC113326017 n=1 Tax=Papaver somniferum TaxID=3469 RepID=UPI000E6F53D7|nr:uncharacterized protein LOC113326017 [Papaver somniferum]